MVMAKEESATFNRPGKYIDHSAGQRQGAIGHYASRIVSAMVLSGGIENEEAAVESFHKIVKGIEEGFGK